MHVHTVFISTTVALTAAPPLLEERQNSGLAYCSMAAARSSCNIDFITPFPSAAADRVMLFATVALAEDIPSIRLARYAAFPFHDQ